MQDFYAFILTIFHLFELPVAWHHLQTLLITVAPINPSNLPSLAKAPHRVGMAILILAECGPPNLVQTPQKLPSPKFQLQAPETTWPCQPMVLEPLDEELNHKAKPHV